METVAIFVIGVVVGWILYPAAELIGKVIRNAWAASHGCTGNCNQGRTCDCGRK